MIRGRKRGGIVRRNIFRFSVITTAFVSVIFIIYLLLNYIETPIIHQFEIKQFSDGYYAYRENVVSSVPAQNYTMITVCDMSGNIHTIKGAVKIVEIDRTPPYVVWEDYKIVNSDEIALFVPQNTIQYLGVKAIGR